MKETTFAPNTGEKNAPVNEFVDKGIEWVDIKLKRDTYHRS